MAFELFVGDIEAAKFAYAIPKTPWNKRVLIYCHGCYPAGLPRLANLNTADPLYQDLLSQGWIVAMTSYRREGLIVKDAIQDVHNLRAEIARTQGEPSMVILEGYSMGGAISTLISERYPDRYSGMLGLAAALLVNEDSVEDPITYLHAPRIPILFLTNSGEKGAITAYIKKCAAPHSHDPSVKVFTPALWEVSRLGHGNVNHIERSRTLNALLEWIASGSTEIAPGLDNRDITTDLPPRPSEVIFNENATAATGVVTRVEVTGELCTNFQEIDLAELGLRAGKTLTVRFVDTDPPNGREFVAYYGTSGDSFDVRVPRGAFMLWVHASGTVVITKNATAWTTRDMVSEEAGAGVGSRVVFERRESNITRGAAKGASSVARLASLLQGHLSSN